MITQAALAWNRPDGGWFQPAPSLRSRMASSTRWLRDRRRVDRVPGSPPVTKPRRRQSGHGVA
jgi:hypothetical protein